MSRKTPEEKAADLLRQEKAVFTQRSWDPREPTVQKAFRQLPEWLTQPGGIFAWDDCPPDVDALRMRWRWQP
jgi:hypothetical protein